MGTHLRTLNTSCYRAGPPLTVACEAAGEIEQLCSERNVDEHGEPHRQFQMVEAVTSGIEKLRGELDRSGEEESDTTNVVRSSTPVGSTRRRIWPGLHRHAPWLQCPFMVMCASGPTTSTGPC